MTDPTRGEKLDRLAESFLEHLRRGAHPALPSTPQNHPDLADEIRELFPALIEMEGLKHPTGGLEPWGTSSSMRAAHSRHPDQLGDYRIIQLIGRGGMGVVYEAERESLTTRVALKVLHPRIRDDAQYRRRFRNEARSAARLHHSHIVTVFDFGEHDGTLYYVMQFIAGQSLDRILQDVRRIREAAWRAPSNERAIETLTIAAALQTGRFSTGSNTSDPAMEATAPESFDRHDMSLAMRDPGREPGQDDEYSCRSAVSSSTALTDSGGDRYFREVARIGAEAADALEYAHSRGVQHRDIKPSNLMLDAQGTAWITDFGLAKIEGDDGLTETGDVVGTLRYLAPERFEGRSDARCDLYALGVTLYEMLALRPAFEGSDRVRVIRQILQGTPRSLRQIEPRISRDMETVVHKAMARMPGDRYQSAADLAAELRRVVANQPILARRSPLHEQYWRWCKRNRLAAGLTALTGALMVAVAVISTAAYVWQSHLNTEILTQLQRVERAEKEGECAALGGEARRSPRRGGTAAARANASRPWPPSRMRLESAATSGTRRNGRTRCATRRSPCWRCPTCRSRKRSPTELAGNSLMFPMTSSGFASATTRATARCAAFPIRAWSSGCPTYQARAGLVSVRKNG